MESDNNLLILGKGRIIAPSESLQSNMVINKLMCKE